ncbi:MAG: GGDEF domain-containing protein [Sphingomonadales bacterium]
MGLKPALHHPLIDSDTNPFVGRMANRLVHSFSSDTVDSTQDRWALVTEVLGYAAEAEQKMSEQLQRIRDLEALTVTDELTGVSNRRGLDDFLKRALANARRHMETGVVAFMDLDDFKSINDQYGHEAGDRALKKVARVLTENTRATDFVTRAGGDEFVVVLTHCSPRDGARRMRVLRRLVEDIVLERSGRRVLLRSSLGIVSYTGTSRAALLLAKADERMYRDKAKRRNTT